MLKAEGKCAHNMKLACRTGNHRQTYAYSGISTLSKKKPGIHCVEPLAADCSAPQVL